jgi:hypothetical protein
MLYPADVLRKNLDVVLVALLLLGVGIGFGAQPGPVEAIRSDAAQRDTTLYRNVPKTMFDIFVNNAMISAFSTIGVFYSIYAAVFQIGIVYGAIFMINGPQSFILVMITFGLLEFAASFFGVFAGLYILKRFGELVLNKLFGRRISEQDGLRSVITVFLTSLGLLLPAALIEACLLFAVYYSAVLLPFVVVGGAFTTGLLLYYVLVSMGERESPEALALG